MRNRAPLALMEQIVMLLVFAMAAVICLRAFVWSDIISRRDALRDEALIAAQSAAEVLKSTKGDFRVAADMLGGAVADGEWIVKRADYTLTAAITAHTTHLGQAEITVVVHEKEVETITVAWQEVDT